MFDTQLSIIPNQNILFNGNLYHMLIIYKIILIQIINVY